MDGKAKLDSVPRPALYLAGGALVALVLHFATCRVFDTGVHLVAHECLGHALAGWLMGRVSVPALWVTHWSEEPSRVLNFFVLAALAGGAYRCWIDDRKPLAYGLAAGAVVYPVFAFTGLNELLVIAGGHLGEIGWGAFFFYRAARGGFSAELEAQERPCYAALGWFLWIGNVVLFFQLATNGLERAHYESISLVEGVQNDFVRVAEMCHSTLARVSAFMLVLSLVVPPLGAALGWLRAKGA